MKLHQSNKSKLLFVLKSIILIGLGLVIYTHIFQYKDWDKLSTLFFKQLDSAHWIYLIIAVILMPFNWLLETAKWHCLVNKFEKVSFLRASKAILLGIVMALITPARIGEYAGRLSLLREKSKSIAATLLGSIAQNLITLLVGILAVYTFIDHFSDLNLDHYKKDLYSMIIGIVILVLTWFYFHMSAILRFLDQFSFIRKYTQYIDNLNHYSQKILAKVLVLSLLRYLVYLGQYFLLLLFFGIHADSSILLAGIAILFLIQSGIPLPPVLSIFARGELAILIWSNVSDNTIAAVAVSFSLWIINLIIPSLLGLIVMFRTRLFRS